MLGEKPTGARMILSRGIDEFIEQLIWKSWHVVPSNGSRLRCGALKKDSFHNLRAPSASSAC